MISDSPGERRHSNVGCSLNSIRERLDLCALKSGERLRKIIYYVLSGARNDLPKSCFPVHDNEFIRTYFVELQKEVAGSLHSGSVWVENNDGDME